MISIPIISLSINESLKKFINKLLSKNQYENKSKLIRDALLRLMSTMDTATLDLDSEVVDISKRIIGNMIIVIPNDYNIQKKINKIESVFNKQIVSKNQHFHQNGLTIFMVYEGYLEDFHKLVVEINSINEIKNFRYLIVN
ncbi:MAG: hypothetical protein KGD63_13525 [Candidatus Lokiarchaeota archaeon]|nr:hypothetical protein [Candidatus Lokiarchaeota archaeon]